MRIRTTVRVTVVALTFGAILTAPAGAYAGQPHDVTPGAACSTPGAVGFKHGVKYVCEQKHGERCPFWHALPKPGPHTTPWSHGPCTTCSPTPSHPQPSHSHSPKPSRSPSQTPTPTPSATPSSTPTGGTAGTPGTTPAVVVAGELPVTGFSVRAAVLYGSLMALLGAGILFVTRRRRTGVV
jgi:LPXTG-motif cell wall-anchored protein